MTTPYKGYLTRSQLSKRAGWSATVVDMFMPVPDKLLPNPRYKKQPPAKLYSLTRVELIEESAPFKEQLYSTDLRKGRAAKAVATKQAALLAYVANLEIKVPRMSVDELTFRACERYNQRAQNKAWQGYTRGFEPDHIPTAEPADDPDFIARISLNYVRHELTSYDKHLNYLSQRTGVEEACVALKEHVNAAIIAVYPHLDPKLDLIREQPQPDLPHDTQL